MKEKARIIKLVCSALICLLGLVMLVQGLFDGTPKYYGSYVEDQTYGGDAYTGIQNAVGDTANNVKNAGVFLSETIEKAYLFGGLLMMAVGAYLFACNIVPEKNDGNGTAVLSNVTATATNVVTAQEQNEEPLSPGEKRCWSCGTVQSASHTYCYKCNEIL